MRKSKSFLQRRGASTTGFTLVELLIAMAVFGVISAAAFGLMAQHQPLFNQQQIQAALNISMRNSVAQLQSDIVNGGSGYYNTVNVPNWPVGVVITNNPLPPAAPLGPTDDCRTGPLTYGVNCFDSLTVIVSDPATTPVNPIASTTGAIPNSTDAGKCVNQTTDTHNNTKIYLLPPTGVTAATYAASFHNTDQILLVTSSGSRYTTTQLTHDGQTAVVGTTTYAVLTHGTTYADGHNDWNDDVTGMSVHSIDQTGSTFCDTDWVIRLIPVKYYVDLTNAADPKLTRQTLGYGGNTSVLADQIIGFKVGAALINATGTTDTSTYNFNSSTFQLPTGTTGFDYTMIRSVMISLVGRTPPVEDPTYTFRNSFDGGPYQIQGLSIVVNPRNMSM
jgi:prepilin-type N-terminal cleavage/methylation domain-containing protein